MILINKSEHYQIIHRPRRRLFSCLLLLLHNEVLPHTDNSPPKRLAVIPVKKKIFLNARPPCISDRHLTVLQLMVIVIGRDAGLFAQNGWLGGGAGWDTVVFCRYIVSSWGDGPSGPNSSSKAFSCTSRPHHPILLPSVRRWMPHSWGQAGPAEADPPAFGASNRLGSNQYRSKGPGNKGP